MKLSNDEARRCECVICFVLFAACFSQRYRH